MAARLGARVHLGTAVAAILHSTDGVRLGLAGNPGGATGAFDRVIMTVPVSLLPGLVFEPALPGWKRAAWSRVAVAHAAKLHVPLTTPATPSAVLSVNDM